jgi:FHA domain
MNVTEFLERWGRSVFENPLATAAADSPPELAEIRFAVLEEVRRKSYRAGARMVFPFDLVRVSMRGVEESRAAAFRSGFFHSYLAHEIQGRLRADSVRFPEQLGVEVEVTTGLPLPGEEWLTVVAGSQEQNASSRGRARLVVRQGSANFAELAVEKPRVYIGREVDVYRDGGIRRRNDLAFAEDSVSREHAHIDYDERTGEYRLFNDRWYTRGTDCGTRIVRDGVSLEVHRDTRGTRLEPGDEIHLGRAVVSLIMQT